VGRNDRRMARSHGFVATAYTRRTANSDLPGDIFGRHLQDLRRMRPGSGCRDRLSRSWCLAASRGRDGCSRCPSWRKLGFPGPPHNGRSDRQGDSSSLTPSPSRSAGLEGRGVSTSRCTWETKIDSDDPPRSAACPAGFFLRLGSSSLSVVKRPAQAAHSRSVLKEPTFTGALCQ
jgi:hypothetical protein